MCHDLKNASFFSLTMDESCDITDTEQLIVWTRFDVGDGFKEELLALLQCCHFEIPLDVKTYTQQLKNIW